MAQRETITVTRHGRPAVYCLWRDTDELLETRRRRSRAFAELEEWAAQAANGRSATQAAAAATRLTDEEVNRVVHSSR
jgi:PHD/YefM family antitoxin component YafN of YafNO toxin-antitoxin module